MERSAQRMQCRLTTFGQWTIENQVAETATNLRVVGRTVRNRARRSRLGIRTGNSMQQLGADQLFISIEV